MVPCDIRVIYGDTDQMGIVYYANYLRYFEAGRGAFLRAHGKRYGDIEASGVRLPVVEAKVNYRAPARYDDLLRVETTLAEVRRVSVRFTYQVRRGEEAIAEGETTHACLGPSGKPTRVPADIAELA